jgi:peptidoglycan/LPS O-acetylase OafA/YrhL
MASTATERGNEILTRERHAPGAGVPGRGSQAATTRYHAIDALRGVAMFLVISLHAALGYIERGIPSVLWCIRDAPTLPCFDWFCWWCMSVSNPLYFTIAGFFAVYLYDSRGLRGYVASRARRILVPFAVGLVTVGPACIVAWSYGWLVAGRCNLRSILRLRFRDPEIRAELWGPGHLWFLEYLLLMLLAYGVVRWWSAGRGPSRLRLRKWSDAALESPWRPLLLAIPTTAVLWISRQRLGIDAVLDRHNSFVPDPLKFLHHASFFIVGAGLYCLRHSLLPRLARVGPMYLALTIPVFMGRAYLLGRDWTTPLVGPAALALAVLGALLAWLIVLGFIGLFLRLFKQSHPLISYLADSSYWIYLVHMPVIGLLQVDLYRIPGHALWKFPIVWAVTLALGFASYQTLVRYTALGVWLHGRRERPPGRAAG